MLTSDLKVFALDFVTLTLELVSDLQEVMAKQQQNLRPYDSIVNWAHFNAQNSLLTLSLIGEGVTMFKLDKSQATMFWSLPSPQQTTSVALCMSFCPQLEKAVVAYDSNFI